MYVKKDVLHGFKVGKPTLEIGGVGRGWELLQLALPRVTASVAISAGNSFGIVLWSVQGICPWGRMNSPLCLFSEAQELLRQLHAQEQQLRLDIAVALQQLNLLRPDGGSRLPEAEEHYRAVIASLDSELAPPLRSPRENPVRQGPLDPDSRLRKEEENKDPGADMDPEARRLRLMRLMLVGNLAALLLEADRPHHALLELEGGLREAEILLGASAGGAGISGAGGAAPPSPSPSGTSWLSSSVCALRFNRGKALAAVGRTAESESAYVNTALGALGLDPNCFAKACAAMNRLPDDLLTFVQSAVQLAEESGLLQRLLTGAPRPPTTTTTTTTAVGGGGINHGDGGVVGGLAAGSSDPFGDQSRGGWLADIGVSELGWLYFALAKALETRDVEAEEVWRVLDQVSPKEANSLISSQQPYHPDTDWQQLLTLRGVFGGRLMRQLAAGGGREGEGGEESPVFVVGLPRSGSTLVETMLSRYPGVWAAGEDTALAPLTPRLNELLMKQGLSNRAALADFGRRYVEEMRRRAVASGWDPNNPPVRIVDKMLRNLWLIGYIEMLLPRACIVHVVRHPLDVALSCYSQPFGYSGVPWSWRLDHIGEQIRMAAALGAHWGQVLPPGRLLTLHYEQVSARQLLSHCGLTWDVRVLDFHTANRTVATASVAQVRKPLYNTSVGRWRKYEKQLAALAAQIRPEILSYEADLDAALRIAEAENRQLQLQQQQQQHPPGQQPPPVSRGARQLPVSAEDVNAAEGGSRVVSEPGEEEEEVVVEELQSRVGGGGGGSGLPMSTNSSGMSGGTPSLRQYHSPVRKWVWAAFGGNVVLAVIFAALCASSYKTFRAAVEQLDRGETAGFPAGSKASDWQRLFAGAAISAAFAVVLTVFFHAWALILLLCSFKSLADPNRRFGRAFVMAAALCIGLHILNIALQFHGYGPTLSTWHSQYGAPFNVTLLNTCVVFGLLSFLNYTLLAGLLFFWQDPTDVYLLDRRELHPAGVQLQLGSSSSFKVQDTSILGSAALMAKLAQSISAPNQPLLASRTSTLDSHVYASGNPVISTATASRPSSASGRQPCSGTPSGGAAQTVEPLTSSSSNNNINKTSGSDTSTARQDGPELRMQGDIQGGSSTRPKSGLLRRLSSLTLGYRPPSARQEAASDSAAGAAAPSTAATNKGTVANQSGGRAQLELCPSIPRSAAIPCVDVDPERRQLLRRLSLRENSTYAGGVPQSSGGATRPRLLVDAVGAPGAVTAAVATVEPRISGCSGRGMLRASASSGGAGAPLATKQPPPPPPLPAAAIPAAAALVTDTAGSDRPPTPLRRLTNLLLPNSLMISHHARSTEASTDQRDQDGVGAVKRRPSSGGVRNLFSRPSSAKRKSEAGVWATSQLHPPAPVEAWKQQQGQDSLDDRDVDGSLSSRVLEYGVVPVRQPGGIIKRAANALATALTG
ncbi:hypothetical protein VOLCADRAFT_96413 [Volvox carteri f. nagariensis]|uniref:protein-tyrosine sulfotransferase n=1 Tax=Volvox carteri f. nagariensis TaxID=3068 RepID=D8UA16_VOLCA|nr:uncharacterized protein VOLCADRAFT_96413 [Volvox carteri f. nagariensis]EFJ43393.1 hypothetical protein VOLCADRAFT_96413 [Volvox carteri f. nagariensis]|eukprot:XP_002955540.1 hypothetical protein VOLCADRAFT_96413 [Volvox carteri f. nagariensis]